MSFFEKFNKSPQELPIQAQREKEYPDLFNTTVSSVVDPVDQASSIRSIMPHFWSSEDTRRAVIFSLLPTGAVLVGSAALCQDHKYKLFLDTTRVPHWAPRERWFYSALDVATSLPLGYASYLVFKHGGGFEYADTSVALGLYGTNLLLALASVPLLKARNLNGLACNALLVHLTAVAAAIAFYKIDKTAGYWLIPYALWTGFYALLGYSAKQLNKGPNFD